MDRKQSKLNIENLVQTYDQGKRERINEAETRLRFIDPFFEALGWDIRNPKEVRVEFALARSDSTRPDYRFLIDGKTKFFVEAKNPSVKLTDPAPIFQAKSYGFSSKVPIVVLTDFEEFRPFRTLGRPKFDRPIDGLIKEFDYTYDRYVVVHDELYDTFSHDAVAAGELEKRIPTEKKEASATVDKEFLKDLSGWQEELAKNIAIRNTNLSVSEINEAVQRILDRFIFLRICEDRQIEENEILLGYADKDAIYSKLLKEFARLRSKYNGLIFNEHRLTEQLSIDDKVLKDIIKNLYLPYSPYRFNEIPIAILGTIYEQYLGKVITLTPTHRAKVEVKPEVRKAGGVFYTPHFITSYIVKNTIGKLIEGKTPEQIARMRFADIACGSGSFLLEMFDFLIRYHVDYYSANPDKVKTIDGVPDAFQTPDALWHLSTHKKKEILGNNIYGVDIDPQAVEVTQMSLYLKLLEGESAETFGKQLSLELKETILPSLSNNIKCGNSLVGMDIKGLGNNLSLDEEVRIRPFDWDTAFPDVMAQGGFDSIVGNPPYIRIQEMKDNAPIVVQYFKQSYHSAISGNYDIYVVCVEKALSLLHKEGLLGFILPNKFFSTDYGAALRQLIADRKCLYQIVDFGHNQVFEEATTYTCLLFLSSKATDSVSYARIHNPEILQSSEIDFRAMGIDCFSGEPWSFSTDAEQQLNKKISKSSLALGELGARIGRGSSTGDDNVFMLHQVGKKFLTREGEEINIEKEILRIPIYATDYNRYSFGPSSGEFVIFPYNVSTNGYTLVSEPDLKKDYPKAYEYLLDRKKILEARKQYQAWYGFSAPRNLDVHAKAQILVPLLADRGLYCRLPDDTSQYCLMASGGFSITMPPHSSLSPDYILGLLNSTLLFWKLHSISNIFRGGWITCTKQYVETLPIHILDFNISADKALHDKMVQLVERMLDLRKKKQHANADSEKELFEHQIKATDREIDELVYGLYGLSEEEIKVVQNA